jgi:hypothetical protein
MLSLLREQRTRRCIDSDKTPRSHEGLVYAELGRLHAAFFAERKPSTVLSNTPLPWEPYMQDRTDRTSCMRVGQH